jgi:hypothetical protein
MTTDTSGPSLSPLLKLVRWSVAALAAIALASLVAGVWRFPNYVAANPGIYLPTQAWTAELLVAALDELGWPPLTVAWFKLFQDVISVVVNVGLGLVILLRGPRSWFGVYVALTFVALGYSNAIFRALPAAVPLVGYLTTVFGQLGWQLSFILFYVFPDGRFVPHWSRWLLLPWLAVNVLSLPIFVPELFSEYWWPPMVLVFSAIGSQVYRYFRRAGPVQRAQTKWIVYAVGLLAPMALVYGLVVPLSPDQAPAMERVASALQTTLLFQILSWAGGLMIPTAIAVAILRYRLWDIDVIIRKTLVYSVLTGLLAVVYFGTIIVLQTVFGSLTGEQSPVVIVVSTLIIAALFSSLRGRVQTVIDRRFFRQKYDAEQVLERFAHTARDEVELGALTAEMVRVVEETMRPAVVAIWLKETVPGRQSVVEAPYRRN